MASKVDTLPSQLVHSWDCKQGAVRAVRHNVDGNYVLTCGQDKSLKLWNHKKNILLKAYTGHGYEVLDARGSCDNSQLVSCGMDKTLIVWDVSTGSALRKYRGHAGTVNCVRFNEDSSVAMSGSVDGSVKCWDVKSKRMEPIQSIEEMKDSVTSIDVSDHEILVGSADCRVRRYDLRNGLLLTDYVGTPISSVSFTKDGQCLLISSINDTIKLFDKSSGELLQEFRGHINKDYRIDAVLNNSDKFVLSGSENGFVYVWDLVEGNVVRKLDHEGSKTVHSLSFHPEMPEVVSAAREKVYVWGQGEEEES